MLLEQRDQWFKACSDGDLDQIRTLLTVNNFLNTHDIREKTGLHLACMNGHVNVVKFLAQNEDIDINAVDQAGYTGLHYASLNGFSSVAASLLLANCDVNKKTVSNHTGLHFASLFGHSHVVSLLVQSKCDVNSQDISGSTPLHCACMLDHGKIIPTLFEGGVRFDIKDAHGFAAQGYAIGRRHKKCIQALVDFGCIFSEEELLNNLVSDAFEENARKRSDCKSSLIQCRVDERIIEYTILPFLFPSPQIGKNVFIY